MNLHIIYYFSLKAIFNCGLIAGKGTDYDTGPILDFFLSLYDPAVHQYSLTE